MLTRARDVLLGLAIVALMAPTAFAEKPIWAGGGRGGGGNPGTSDLYGDMVLVDRTVDGVPITVEGLGPGDVWMQVPQPIMIGSKDGCPLWNDELGPQIGDGLLAVPGEDSIYNSFDPIIEAYLIPFVNGEIPEAYLACTIEADFGRLSSARSPEYVIDHALLEMTTSLATGVSFGGTIDVDAAGRLTITYTDELGLLVDKTIDAPLENLAAFQRILEQAELSHPDVNGGQPLTLPSPLGHTGAQHLLERAAPMMGAAGDKSGYIGLDEVVYITQVFAIAEEMSTEAKKVFENPIDGFFNFSEFEYDRSETYSGDVCYLKILGVETNEADEIVVSGQMVREPVLPLVFPPYTVEGGAPSPYVGGLELMGDSTNEDPMDDYVGFTGSNVWAFARASDDARAVIEWVHDHPVPIELIDLCADLPPYGQGGAD